MASSLSTVDRVAFTAVWHPCEPSHFGSPINPLEIMEAKCVAVSKLDQPLKQCGAGQRMFRQSSPVTSHGFSTGCPRDANSALQSNKICSCGVVHPYAKQRLEVALKRLLDFERLSSFQSQDSTFNNESLKSVAFQDHLPFVVADQSFSDGSGRPPNKYFNISVRKVALALFFGGVGAVLHTILSTLPPDFLDRWKKLVSEQPHHDPKSKLDSKGGTTLYDCHGTVIATVVPGGFSGERDPQKPKAPLKPNEIPSAMWQAVIASEDRRFFEHSGVDPRGVSRAVLSLARSGGGSTITQQLVKNVFLTNERKWARKFMEIILAILLEKQMSKWDILHLYLNKIYWGHGVNGIEAASALYFGKHPSNLSLGECAMLAGIIPAPELLSPYRDPSRGRKPQARALRRMVEAGFLDIQTANGAIQEPLQLGVEGKEGKSGPWRAPYFVSEVLHELSQKYGMEEILQGGLQVYTTLDLNMQDAAEKVIREGTIEYDRERVLLAQKGLNKNMAKLKESIKERESHLLASMMVATQRNLGEEYNMETESFKAEKNSSPVSNLGLSEAASMAVIREETRLAKLAQEREKIYRLAVAKYEEELRIANDARLEGSMVCIDPACGSVRVLVGGRDYYESNFNRATQALRPPGSTFKPVVYLSALAEGIERNHVLIDEPYEVGGFAPENYDRKFRGPVTLEEALLRSLNVPTVKLCSEIGVDKVIHMAKLLGIKSPLPRELALSLGGCEVTPLQLATVYSTIASGGIYNKPHIITRVESHDGTVLEEMKPQTERKEPVVNEYAVSELRKLLQAVVERGTGKAARLNRPCAGKTGTSDGHRDVWFAGFTPQLSCIVWLGYDNNLPVGGMHPGTGASHAAPLWKRFMGAIHEGLPVKKFNDIGKDKYGSKAPRVFEKRSRRTQKAYLRDGSRKSSRWADRPLQTWKDVWDWEKASSAWEEKEKMDEWSRARKRRTEELKALRAIWQSRSTSDPSTSSSEPLISPLPEPEKERLFSDSKEEAFPEMFFAAEIAARAKWGNDEYDGVWEEGYYVNKKGGNYTGNLQVGGIKGSLSGVSSAPAGSPAASTLAAAGPSTQSSSSSFSPSTTPESSSWSHSTTGLNSAASVESNVAVDNGSDASGYNDSVDLEMGDPCILIRGNVKSSGLFSRGKYYNQPLPYCAERPALPKISRRRAGVDWTEKDGRDRMNQRGIPAAASMDAPDVLSKEKFADYDGVMERDFRVEDEGFSRLDDSSSSYVSSFSFDAASWKEDLPGTNRNVSSDTEASVEKRTKLKKVLTSVEEKRKKGAATEKKTTVPSLPNLRKLKSGKSDDGDPSGSLQATPVTDESEFVSSPLYKADGNMTSEVSGLLPQDESSGLLGLVQSGLNSVAGSFKYIFAKTGGVEGRK